MTRGWFTFRDVAHAVGIPSTNEHNWQIGQMLRDLAAKKGIEPERLLTRKTDPNPTVSAPHCIAHYPDSLFPEAVERVKQWWGDRARQQALPLG